MLAVRTGSTSHWGWGMPPLLYVQVEVRDDGDRTKFKVEGVIVNSRYSQRAEVVLRPSGLPL